MSELFFTQELHFRLYHRWSKFYNLNLYYIHGEELNHQGHTAPGKMSDVLSEEGEDIPLLYNKLKGPLLWDHF